MMSSTPVPECLTQNFCETRNPETDAPLCGFIPEHLPSAPFASDLCIRALLGRREMLQAGREYDDFDRATKDASLSLQQAWSELEIAMSLSTSENDLVGHFTEANSYASDVLNETNHNFMQAMSARLLQAYLPAFELERHDEYLTRDDFFEMRLAVSQLYDDLKKAPIHTFKQDGEHFQWDKHDACISAEYERHAIAIKLGLYMLAARSGIVLYPASVREADGVGESNLSQHHDMFLLDRGRKIPIKVRAKSKGQLANPHYDDDILYISWHGLVGLSVHQTGYNRFRQGDRDAIAAQVMDWMHDEANGTKLSSDKWNILLQIKRNFVAQIEDYRNARSKKSTPLVRPVNSFNREGVFVTRPGAPQQ